MLSAQAALLILICPVVAIVGHEALHYLTIWPIAENVRIVRRSRWRVAVEYDIYNDPWRLKWSHVSNLSPLIVGIGGMLAMWATMGLPAFAVENAGPYLGWIAFTVGGPADYGV